MANNVYFEKPRNVKEITDKKKILNIFEHYFSQSYFYLKGLDKKINTKLEINDKHFLKLSLPHSHKVKENLVIYTLYPNYIQLELEYVKTIAMGKHKYRPMKLSIAVTDRKETRYPVNDGSICIQELSVLQNEQILTTPKIKSSISTFMHEYSEMIDSFFPNVEIGYLNNDNQLLGLVFDNEKALFIKDTQDENSYYSSDNNILNFSEYVGSNIQQNMDYFKNLDMQSFFLYPVSYKTVSGKTIPLAYIKIWAGSQDNALDLDSIISFVDFISYLMIKNIKESLYIHIEEQQKVLNISRQGIRLLIDSSSLEEFFIGQFSSEEMKLNIQFNFPEQRKYLSLQGEVVSVMMNPMDDLEIGIKFNAINEKELKLMDKCLNQWSEDQTSNIQAQKHKEAVLV